MSTSRQPLSPLRSNSPRSAFRDRKSSPLTPRVPSFNSPTNKTSTKIPFRNEQNQEGNEIKENILTTPTRIAESKLSTITPYKIRVHDDNDVNDDIADLLKQDQARLQQAVVLKDIEFQTQNKDTINTVPDTIDTTTNSRIDAKRIHVLLNILTQSSSSNWEARQKALHQLAYRIRTAEHASSFLNNGKIGTLLKIAQRALQTSLKDTRPRIVQASCDVVCALVEQLSQAHHEDAAAKISTTVLPRLFTLCVSRQLSFKAPSRRALRTISCNCLTHAMVSSLVVDQLVTSKSADVRALCIKTFLHRLQKHGQQQQQNLSLCK